MIDFPATRRIVLFVGICLLPMWSLAADGKPNILLILADLHFMRCSVD
jgi:hypothetical protein